jgi:hypothetical protein
MDLFARKTRSLLNQVLSELASTRSSLDLERTNRIAAEQLANAYRESADRANELARKFEDERSRATKELVESLRTTNKQLIDAATPKEDTRTLATVKEQLSKLPKQSTVNPLRKAFIDSDRSLLKSQFDSIKTQLHARTGIPSVDTVLDAAHKIKSEEKPN